jgi:DNA-binding NtrC family response regulator
MASIPVVLIVEDEAVIRMTVASDLADTGFEAIEASNADEALELLDGRDDIGALFTDIDMPGSHDGLELAHIVAQRWPSIRIIITSGRSWPIAGSLPTDSLFFPKPYAHETIIDALRMMLSR